MLELSALKFFAKYCSADWLPLIEHHQVIKNIPKDEIFVNEGDTVNGMYVLLTGKVKISGHFYGTEPHIIRLAEGISLVGHRSMYSNEFSISATALTDCVVSFIPLDLFKKLIRANPEFDEFLLEFLVKELKESEEQQYMLTIDNVRRRVAYSLVQLVGVFGYREGSQMLSFTLAKKDIANLCNTTYESVIRTISALEREGILKSEGKNIIVKDERQLKFIAFGYYAD